jgi:glycerol-3-phosphate dehydrogenase
MNNQAGHAGGWIRSGTGEGATRLTEPYYDLVVVGGGINGAGIARDAAGRGYSVLLCEQDDLAAHTSSASTKLIHGGLRYLEHYQFSLVRKALTEREVLLRNAPHIIWPLRFVMPYTGSLRPAWLIRAGLFLYDHLGRRKRLPASRGVRLREHPAGRPLRPELEQGFVYSDCWVQDARLVVLNALDAAERGACVSPRTRCVGADRGTDRWRLTLRAADGGPERTVVARCLVNAAGPWVKRFLQETAGMDTEIGVRLVKGSHIVVPRLFDHAYCYIFQNPDRRIVFAIPYERDYTLIGTTDVPFEGDPAQAEIAADEADYLCETINRYCRGRIGPRDIVWTYSGVRLLYDAHGEEDVSAVTRDYLLALDRTRAPILSVFGGKITTYRRLAEQAMREIEAVLGHRRPCWTAEAPLPGGDMADADFDRFLRTLRKRCPWLPEPLALRYARSYGTRVERLLGNANALTDLGACYGADLYEREVAYLITNEWARTAEDILWRRSKLGLRIRPAAVARLEARLAVAAKIAGSI